MGKKDNGCNSIKDLEDEIFLQNEVNNSNIFLICKLENENSILKLHNYGLASKMKEFKKIKRFYSNPLISISYGLYQYFKIIIKLSNYLFVRSRIMDLFKNEHFNKYFSIGESISKVDSSKKSREHLFLILLSFLIFVNFNDQRLGNFLKTITNLLLYIFEFTMILVINVFFLRFFKMTSVIRTVS